MAAPKAFAKPFTKPVSVFTETRLARGIPIVRKKQGLLKRFTPFTELLKGPGFLAKPFTSGVGSSEARHLQRPQRHSRARRLPRRAEVAGPPPGVRARGGRHRREIPGGERLVYRRLPQAGLRSLKVCVYLRSLNSFHGVLFKVVSILA